MGVAGVDGISLQLVLVARLGGTRALFAAGWRPHAIPHTGVRRSASDLGILCGLFRTLWQCHGFITDGFQLARRVSLLLAANGIRASHCRN